MSSRRVAVLLGGRSSERNVSLASGQSVISGLCNAGHEPVPVEIDASGQWQLSSVTAPSELVGAATATPHDGTPVSASGWQAPPLPLGRHPLEGIDVVFPVLHGPFGEDGTIQGLLELLEIPYVGSGVAASAIAMDKALFKAVADAQGLPIARSATFVAGRGEEVENPFSLPVVVKPARLGSSVGISVARTAEDFMGAVKLALAHDDKIIVEEFIDGTEVECSVLGNDEPAASAVGEIVVVGRDWYSYEAKYTEGGMNLIVPARIPADSAEAVRSIAVQAFQACDCRGMARVDFFVRADGSVVLSELNTIPGFTATSVYAKLFKASGLDYPQLLDRLVGLAIERFEQRRALRY